MEISCPGRFGLFRYCVSAQCVS